jgi:hypothetical protein
VSPIRVFVCIKGHETEKVLFGERDQTLQQVICHVCRRPAARMDQPQRTGAPILRKGIGGFHKPTK